MKISLYIEHLSIMKYSLTLLFIGLLSVCYGQQERHFQVVNAEDGSAVPYATVILTVSQSGFGTNQNGVFRLDLETRDKNELIQITSIGYATFEATVGELLLKKDDIIKLTPSAILLSEIQVQAERQTPEGMIEKTSKHLNKNMNKKPYYVTGLYNEHVKKDNQSMGYTDAYGLVYVTAYDPAFNRKNEMFGNDLAQWKEIRRTTYTVNDHCDSSKNKTFAIDELLEVKRKLIYDGPLNKGNLNDYKYQYDSVTTYNGKDIFIIHFESDTEEIEGQVYVVADDFALLKMKVMGTNFKQFNDCYDNNPYTFEIEFSFVLDQYQLKFMSLDHYYGVDTALKEHVELSTNQFAKQDARPLNLDQRTILYNEMKNPFISYNSSFWLESGVELDSMLLSTYKSEEGIVEQFKMNSDQRIIPLPENINSYETLYQNRQLFQLFINDDF